MLFAEHGDHESGIKCYATVTRFAGPTAKKHSPDIEPVIWQVDMISDEEM